MKMMTEARRTQARKWPRGRNGQGCGWVEGAEWKKGRVVKGKWAGPKEKRKWAEPREESGPSPEGEEKFKTEVQM